MTKNLLWGIDLGGTKIEGAVFPADDPFNPSARIRIDTEAQFGYEHILSRIKELVGLLSAAVGESPLRVGFSTPGALDPNTKVMKNCNTTSLNNKPLDEDLEKILGIPVTLANDANCFALTEYRYGAAKNSPLVFGVIMGTGIGGGIVCDGRLINGAHGIAGEWGHNVIEPTGPECYCGRNGCIERLMAGPRIEEYYTQCAHQTKKLVDIYHDATVNERFAVQTISYLEDLFARAVSTVINILDPDTIVLGGGLSNLPIFYTNSMREKIKKSIFNNSFQAKLVKNELGDSAGVFGGGLLTVRELP